MNRRTHEILRTDEDRVSWDKYIEHVDVLDQLTSEQKERVKEAFQYLRQPDVLGERFLSRAHVKGHPLFEYFVNTSPWTRKWLTRFTAAMKSLRDAEGFSTCMKEEIKDAEEFSERESVLEVAYKFFNAGFEVSFDPSVTVLRPRGFTNRLVPTQKAPDLKIVNRENGEEIIVEVSAQSKSDLSKQCSRIYHTVFEILVSYALHREYLFPCARIDRILDDDELKVLEGELWQLIEKVKGSGQVEYLINNKIEACLAPEHQKDVPNQWGDERGIKVIPIEGPSIPLKDPLRLKRNIRKEQEQLPVDRSGIVVITADWTLLFHAHGPLTIMSEVEDVMNDLPKVSCAVVSCSYQSGDEEGYACSEGQHTIIKRTTDEELIEETIISRNPSCAIQLSTATFDKVRAAFILG